MGIGVWELIIVGAAFVPLLIDKCFGKRLWGQHPNMKMSVPQTLFSYQGRINRKKWWLMHLLISAILVFIGTLLSVLRLGETAAFLIGSIFFWCSTWALVVKRWHDRDKSAWWILIIPIPIAGIIWALIELGFSRGTDGPNRYGDDPLGVEQQ